MLFGSIGYLLLLADIEAQKANIVPRISEWCGKWIFESNRIMQFWSPAVQQQYNWAILIIS